MAVVVAALVGRTLDGASVLWASLVWEQKGLTCGQQVPCAVAAGTPPSVRAVPLYLASSLDGTMGTWAASCVGPGVSLPQLVLDRTPYGAGHTFGAQS